MKIFPNWFSAGQNIVITILVFVLFGGIVWASGIDFNVTDSSIGSIGENISITASQISDHDYNHSHVAYGSIDGGLTGSDDFVYNGDVELFGDTDVGNSENGQMLYVRRRAAEGNNYMRMYITSSRAGMFHSNADMTFQGQTGFTINSVTGDVVLKVGDNAGNKSIGFRDSDSNTVAEIDSNGNLTADKIYLNDSGTDYLGWTAGDSVFEFSGGLMLNGTLFAGNISGGDWTGATIDATDEVMTPIIYNTDGDTVTIQDKLSVTGIISSFDGDVGIGTTAPALPLEVRSENDNLALFFDDTAYAEGVGGGIAFGGRFGSEAWAEAMSGRIGTKKTNGIDGDIGFDMVLQTQDSVGNITERMILTSDGKVGINVTPFSSPTKTLDVWGDARIRGELTIDDAITPLTFTNSTGIKLDLYGNDTYAIGVESSELIIASNSKITFRTDGYEGDEDVVITDDGYVGIGIASPHDDFHIASASPSFVFEETDAINSEKVWEWMAVNGKLSLKTQSDVYSASQTVMSIDRGGTSPTEIDFPNSTMILGDLAGSYSGGSAYVCVYNSGELFTSNSPCP